MTKEEEVFGAVMKWLKHDVKRLTHTYELLSLVRLPLLSKEYIVDHVSQDIQLSIPIIQYHLSEVFLLLL